MNKEVYTALAVSTTKMFFSLFIENEISSEDESEDEFKIELIMQSNRVESRYRKIPRVDNYFEHVIPQYSEQEFQNQFRMTQRAFDALLNKLRPYLNGDNRRGRPRKDVKKNLLAVIWLLATPDSYRSVGAMFDLGKASLSDWFGRCIMALHQIASEIIKWPDHNSQNNIKEKFKNFANLNNVIGAVDGTYVPIKAPKYDSEVYITRKRNYAMTLQCISEASLKFIDSFIGYPGSVSDNRIFRNSFIYQNIQDNVAQYFHEENFIIGDKAYPILEWCIPPYIARRELTAIQRNFNIVHAKTRQVVERSFALLFGRFRRLRYLDMNRVDLIPATILAACVLHNICIDHQDLLLDQYIQEGDPFVAENNDEAADIDLPNINVNIPFAKRDNIALHLFHRRN